MYACPVTSVMSDSATPCTVAHQAPLSMGSSRQDYLNGLLCPSTGNLADQGTNTCLLDLLHWQAYSLPLVPPRKPGGGNTVKQKKHHC